MNTRLFDNIGDKVKTISLNIKVVEYRENIYYDYPTDDRPQFIGDVIAPDDFLRYETYTTKVNKIRTPRGDFKIAFEKEAQELIDLFVEIETNDIRAQSEAYKRQMLEYKRQIYSIWYNRLFRFLVKKVFK